MSVQELDLVATFLDVGHGDAIVLRFREGHQVRTVVVDGGGPEHTLLLGPLRSAMTIWLPEPRWLFVRCTIFSSFSYGKPFTASIGDGTPSPLPSASTMSRGSRVATGNDSWARSPIQNSICSALLQLAINSSCVRDADATAAAMMPCE